MHKPDDEDEMDDTANDGSKWVKTDSECKIIFSGEVAVYQSSISCVVLYSNKTKIRTHILFKPNYNM